MSKPDVPRSAPGSDRRRWGRAQRDPVQDSYKLRGKLSGPAACPRCGAVYQEGHWRWGAKRGDAHEEICPACHRIADSYPAGILTLKGGFVAGHEAEIRALAQHQEEAEKREHPLNRIMDIVREGEVLTIRTTDIHLPRRIGEALERAFHGELDFHYDQDAYFIRVDWRRDA